MPEPVNFQHLQERFAAHIRNPGQHPCPEGIEDRRMAIYRGLFYRNIESFISGGFPVLRSIIAEDDWHALVRDFVASHYCQSPYFLQISEEFIGWLQQGRQAQAGDLPFMLELAHYEWVELALDVADVEPDWDRIIPNGDLLAGIPVVSPTAWSLAYQWPVHRIGPANLPTVAGPETTFLVVYRNREDQVKFMESNAATARLLALVQADAPMSGREALLQIASEMGHPDPQALRDMGLGILQQLQEMGIVLGTRR